MDGNDGHPSDAEIKRQSAEKKRAEAAELENSELETAQGESEEAKVDPAAELKERLMYLQADFENQKKRLLREQEQSVRFANEKFVQEFLSVIDLFDRALSAAEPLKAQHKDVENFVIGIEMTHREILHVLQKFDVELTGTVGETFDPTKHEAISQQGVEKERVNTILQVVQKGCYMHGRLLQPAKVVVGTELVTGSDKNDG